MSHIAAGAVIAALLAAGSAAAGGGSPFNGHYVGKSTDGKHHLDINVNGGAVRTTSLKLSCPGRTGYGDFVSDARLAADGRFNVVARGSGSGRPVELRMTAQAGGSLIKGSFTARVGSCNVGPVRFTLRRNGT